MASQSSRFTLLLLLASLSLSFVSADTLTMQELLQDTSFEMNGWNSSSQVPPGNVSSVSAVYCDSSDTGIAHTGICALELDSGYNASFQYATQMVTIPSGTLTLTYSFWLFWSVIVLPNSPNNQTFNVTMLLDSQVVYAVNQTAYYPQDVWTLVNISLVSSQYTHKKPIPFGIYGSFSNSTVWNDYSFVSVDDVSLEALVDVPNYLSSSNNVANILIITALVLLAVIVIGGVVTAIFLRRRRQQLEAGTLTRKKGSHVELNELDDSAPKEDGVKLEGGGKEVKAEGQDRI